MSPDKLLVIFFGATGVVFTYWFFLAKKDSLVIASDNVEITVAGGYSPEAIIIPKNKLTKITFLRKDPSDCLSEIVLGDFRIRKQLPLNQKVTIELNPKTSGEFKYSCGMNMYHGKIIVKD